MTTYRIVITDPAEKDLNEIIDYIAFELRSSSSAENIIIKISNSISSLEQLPKRHPFVKDERLANLGIRMLIIENYIAFYVVFEKDKVVTIIRILYNRRNWSYLF